MESNTETVQNENPILGAVMVCHPPIIVPNVGQGEERRIQDITDAYEQAAAEIGAMNPDTVVIISPHAPSYFDYIQLTSPKISGGDLSQFGDHEDHYSIDNDVELVQEMSRLAEEQNFPMGTLGQQGGNLDHGTVVPLYFLNPQIGHHTWIVRMSIGGLSQLDHYKAGKILAQAAKNLNRKVAVVASGDLSHCQKEGSSYGFKACGPVYDAKIMDVMGKGDFKTLVEMPENEAEDAMSCGQKPFCVMAGALDGLMPESKALAHSAEFGVGYGICTYTHLKEEESRKLEETIENDLKARRHAKRMKEDVYVRFARKNIESFVRDGKTVSLSAHSGLPEEMLKDRAGVFVSIHEFGNLRGCIGTIAPVHENIAAEIAANAASACSADPRFPAVRPDELDYLDINVDVLTKPEPCTKDQLDPKKYGVIVRQGNKRGVLLPDLEGVNSVDEQISIAMQKAGIPSHADDVELERFEVVRHV